MGIVCLTSASLLTLLTSKVTDVFALVSSQALCQFIISTVPKVRFQNFDPQFSQRSPLALNRILLCETVILSPSQSIAEQISSLDSISCPLSSTLRPALFTIASGPPTSESPGTLVLGPQARPVGQNLQTSGPGNLHF